MEKEGNWTMTLVCKICGKIVDVLLDGSEGDGDIVEGICGDCKAKSDPG